MRLRNELPFRQWATIHRNEKFIIVDPLSGYSRHLPEDEVTSFYLEPDAAETALGQAVLQALDKSRFIYYDDEPEFFKIERIIAADERWHQHFMKLYHYETKHDAYQNMLYCEVKRSEGKITIIPHKRDVEPRYWWDLPDDKTVIIPETDDPALVGGAAKLALSHCS